VKYFYNLMFVFIVMLPISVNADKLSLSGQLVLDMPSSELVIHSGSAIIFKYTDWSLTHETINPKTYIGPVDLTGLVKPYIRSALGIKDQLLADWLEMLAKKQFSLYKNNTASHFFVKEREIISIYSDARKQGQIYVFEKNIDHLLVILGDKNYYDAILEQIKVSKK
jgi:hypothetical protein